MSYWKYKIRKEMNHEKHNKNIPLDSMGDSNDNGYPSPDSSR